MDRDGVGAESSSHEAHTRMLCAEQALADALALTAAASRTLIDPLAASILSEYLHAPLTLPLPRHEPAVAVAVAVAGDAPLASRAQGSFLDLLVALGSLSQLLSSLTGVAAGELSDVWELGELLDDELEALVTGTQPGDLALLSDPLPPPSLEEEFVALLRDPTALPPRPCPSPRAQVRTWAGAVHQLQIPRDTPSHAFALVRAGFAPVGPPVLAGAVAACVEVCRARPRLLPRTAAFTALLGAWALRALVSECAVLTGRDEEAILSQVGLLLARRRAR